MAGTRSRCDRPAVESSWVDDPRIATPGGGKFRGPILAAAAEERSASAKRERSRGTMPVIRFNHWQSQGRSPLTRGQRLVTSEVGAERITSGITRFEPGAKI